MTSLGLQLAGLGLFGAIFLLMGIDRLTGSNGELLGKAVPWIVMAFVAIMLLAPFVMS